MQLKPQNTQPLRVGIYARKSPTIKGETGPNYSIPSQLEAERRMAKESFGCEKPVEYIDDEVTGTVLDRPSLTRLRDDVRQKRLDAVIAYSIDRWSRNSVDAIMLRNEMEKAGVSLAFVLGNYETNPQGKLAYGLSAMFAEHEREVFRERVARGRRQKGADGFLNGACPPYGYRYVGKSEGSRGTYAIVPEAAKVVRQIFHWYVADQWSLGQIRNELNRRKVPNYRRRAEAGPKNKARTDLRYSLGLGWAKPVIYRILSREAYTGTFPGKHGPVTIPRIIEPKLFLLAKARAKKQSTQGGRPSTHNLLSGKLYCGVCGFKCHGYGTRAKASYGCGRMDHTNGLRLCKGGGWLRTHMLDDYTWNLLWSRLTDPALLLDAVEAYDVQVKKPDADAPNLEKQIALVNRKLERAEMILADPEAPIPYKQAKKNLDAIRTEKALIEKEIAALGQIIQMPTKSRVKAWCEEIRGAEITSFEWRRAILEQCVDRITWVKNQSLVIECHISLANSAVRNGCKDQDSSNHFVLGETTTYRFLIEARAA